MSLGRYFHTLRHLRPIQFYGRFAHRFHRPRPDTRPAPPLRSGLGRFLLDPARSPSISAEGHLTFLNVTRELPASGGWDMPDVDTLWRYNLHYFVELVARHRDHQATLPSDLLDCWRYGPPRGRLFECSGWRREASASAGTGSNFSE